MVALSMAVLIAGSALLLPPQEADDSRPLAKLIQDLGGASTRAHLTGAQAKQLVTDRAVLDTALLAKENGEAVDRRQVSGAVRSIYGLVDSGAFASPDAQALKHDIDLLRKQ